MVRKHTQTKTTSNSTWFLIVAFVVVLGAFAIHQVLTRGSALQCIIMRGNSEVSVKNLGISQQSNSDSNYWNPNKTYTLVTKKLVEEFSIIVHPDGEVYFDSINEESQKTIALHANDHSHHLPHTPEVVIYPQTTEQVAKIIELCYVNNIAVTVAGARTGLEGGAIPYYGGVVLDMSKMKKVFWLNEQDMLVRVQAGILKSELNTWLDQNTNATLFFAVDPGSDASMGGYASTGASGTLSVRYGTMRENVVSMSVVDGRGRIVRTRAPTVKSSAGYDMHHLYMGAEGTLGVITELTLKVREKPKAVTAVIARFSFNDNNEKGLYGASGAVAALVRLGLASLARCEILNVPAIQAVNLFFNTSKPEVPTLFLELHASSYHELTETHVPLLQSILKTYGASSIQYATEEKERDELWHSRRSAYFASFKLRAGQSNIRLWVTDVCVPLSHLAQLIAETEHDFAVNSSLPCPIVGHVADGNFHCLVPYDSKNQTEVNSLHALVDRMVQRAIAFEGTCTGEHGIGVGKAEALVWERGKVSVELMQAVKEALDPHHILNPGKLFIIS